jgi:hypothetical protein
MVNLLTSVFLATIVASASAQRFTGTLGAKNGVLKRNFIFQGMKLTDRKGAYSDQMVAHCSAYGMKPVCDHRSYCDGDQNAIFLGQTHHLAYKPHRNNNNYAPSGLSKIRNYWNGKCSYTGAANGNNALCNIPTNSHSWRTPAQANPGFICAKVAFFTATIQAKNGAPTESYEFQIYRLKSTSGKYSDRMVETCSQAGMKPICDHPSWCKNDKKSIYLGQSNHLAYKPHRNNNSYSPGGFASIRNQWNGLCSYSGNANGNNAICNIPANSHSWQKPSTNVGFVCGKVFEFHAILGAKNGAAQDFYTFSTGKLLSRKGSYSANMIKKCSAYGMKPVCDHPSYCKSDDKAIYLGQTGHLAYRPHRNNNNYSPPGLSTIRDRWNRLCSYTAGANGNYALCNIPINTHAWRHPGQYDPGFICGKKYGQSFSAFIGGKNGQVGQTWNFQQTFLMNRGGAYATRMIERCNEFGMKPVCDHRNYCAKDKAAAFLGQTHHLAYKPHRQNNNYSPTGFAAIRDKWNGLCSYTAGANGNYALCNIPKNTHAWRHPGQANPGFICARGASFTGSIGAKNGATAMKYQFRILTVQSSSGKYSDRMRDSCKKFDMMPVCDHPSYCKNDARSVYLGQTGHLAYKPHRNNNGYSPPGFAAIRDNWQGLCSYTNNANGNYALCNIPANSHSWQRPSTNPGFVCAAQEVFFAKLGGKNGAPSRKYKFAQAFATPANGKYSTRMVAACKKMGMKPTCDHRNYCKSDKNAMYLGQTHHLAYAPHRNNDGYSPPGFKAIRSKWTGLCSYTGNANGNNALCNIPTNSHSWKNPAQANPGFICASEDVKIFKAKLVGKNGVASRSYLFRYAELSKRSGSYSKQMIAECGNFAMKPVCDHRNYCANDKAALYIGQTHHIAYRPHRNNNNYMPGGFAAVRDQWNNLCSYTGGANGNYALCNIPINTHAWRHPGQANPGFICGKGDSFTAILAAKNGNHKRQYEFEIATLAARNGKYSDRMIESCEKIGMKPVCDHPSYCKTDTANSLYLGQSNHLAYKPHRNNNNYSPGGFASIRDKWNGLCSYTRNANGNNALCNIPANTHAWRNPGQANPGFVCGKGSQFKAALGAKNGVSSKEYVFEKKWLTARSGKYSTRMIESCKKVDMKPVCDHRGYCGNDAKSLFLGQTHHLAYAPHRNNNGYVPVGFAAISGMWSGLCSYTNNANGNYALCNIPTNTHAWRHPGQYDPGFICGREDVETFEGSLKGKNGVSTRKYLFRTVKLTSKSGSYSDLMIAKCGETGMKPVCDHRSWCGNDKKSLFLGQTHHLAYKPHRNNNNYQPTGMAAIRDKWNGLCSYSGTANGNNAICNIPANSHSWQTPAKANPGFICGKGATFTAKLAGKNGVPSKIWEFEQGSLYARSGKYSTRMQEQCKKLGMKPVCDHRNYCKNDNKAVYIGQTHHLAYRPHRNNNNYMPGGFAAIRDKWNGLCSYTNNANGNYALCNIPINTHAWRHPGQYAPGFICGGIMTFSATLGSKNGRPEATYTFTVGSLQSRSGRYSDRMVEQCKKADKDMKPVCDHRNYCRADKKALYIGQDHHLAYRPHRQNKNYMPAGFAAIEKYWTGLCSYTGSANGNYALCNIPTGTHAWRHPGQYNPGFVCGKEMITAFTAKLGAKNGNGARTYLFRVAKSATKSGSYSANMAKACSAFAMKPVCDHRNYCKNDAKAIYIGQTHHIAYRPHRNNNNYMPTGFAAIRGNWDNLCSYTGSANGNYALCNIPINTHAWRHPGQYNPGFVCAKGSSFTAKFGGKNGVAPRVYAFEAATLSARSGKYSDRMREQCGKLGMKPVCDHPSYCRNDKGSLYLGQSNHLAYKPHRNNNSYSPPGLKAIRDKWNGLCSYTGNANKNSALCNIPINSHAWRTPAQANPGFMCAKGDIFKATLGSRNGVSSADYIFEVGILESKSGSYSSLMIKTCAKLDKAMKPVCDHRNYCAGDKKSLYLGQDHHLAYAPHRYNNGYSPAGLSSIAGKWDGLCSYTGGANGNYALCNIPTNTHAWRYPAQYNPGFVCGKEDIVTFSAAIGSKNNNIPTDYDFARVKLTKTSGAYSAGMISRCAAYNMKPVCDHRNYCANDKNAVFLGQTHHLAYRPHRNNNNYSPAGLASIRNQWNGLCSYTAGANGIYALCNIPTNTHAWRHPGQTNPGFICARGSGFSAKLGAKNGVGGRTYQFKIVRLTNRGGKYSDRMIEMCRKVDLKPVCDHRNYCKNDARSIYIGQTHHLAYRPHRNNNGYMPGGFAAIRDKWNGLCSYTNNANGNYALCNIPINTHAWRHPGQYNPGFVCGGPNIFRAKLGAKNGKAAARYAFEALSLTNRGGSYSARMVERCKTVKMKPVCDHRAYCGGGEGGSIWIGQTHHLAYAPHRRNNNYMPTGFAAIASNWDGLCSFTAGANGNYALCNIPTNTHAWRHPGQYNPGFVCGMEVYTEFTAKLGGKNGVSGRAYLFRIAEASPANGKYSDRMRSACGALGMKPVCDHRNYCKNDGGALYIGQTHHLAYRPHRNNNNYSPSGFQAIRNYWNGLCSYTNNANGNYALCNIPINTHAWRHPGQYNPGFVCGKGSSFVAKFGGKNGVPSRTYTFEAALLANRGGKYSDRMREQCKKLNMKPVCDHPSYCKNDDKAVYLGQSGHLAYKPHRNNNSYSPPGLKAVRDNWNGLCSYTNNANGNNALCNIPINSHAWRNPGQANPGFMCARGSSFKAALGAKNGLRSMDWEFEVASLAARNGKYSTRMQQSCKGLGMKPVCDHRSWCGNDKASVWIGQTHHLAYRPHRNNNNYMPSGFAAIRDKWNGLCSYSGNANGNNAICNIPINTHAWRTPAQANPGFMCAKEDIIQFKATIGAKNGATQREYIFRVGKAGSKSGSYADRMKETCAGFSMKPVCDHRNYCQNDKGSVFLGQTHHLAYKPHRNNNSYSPAGLASIRDYWNGLCSYTATANGNYALCNIPKNTHAWRNPAQANPGFVCAAGATFSAKLGAGRNGVAPRSYTFERVYLLARSGKYSTRMQEQCSKFGMKPVCDHPSYCRTDKKSLYLGQANHIAYWPHRKINSWFPAGWSAIRDKWRSLCSYTNNANGNYALCNIPTNTHAWRHPGQYNPGFICGTGLIVKAKLGAKNGVPARKYSFEVTGLQARNGQYSSRMRAACRAIDKDMKPVCDHRNYCRADKGAIYIGQTHHLAYRPHRVNNSYMPAGFAAIAKTWDTLCSYTGNANGNYALCNIPVNTHAWRHPGQYNPGFVCGKEDVVSFTATLQGKNGVGTRTYLFRMAELDSKKGTYSAGMTKACSALAMKPVCDHRNYCAGDDDSLYVGQTHHMAYRPHRMNNNYMPGGFRAVAGMWDGLCSYTGGANGAYALCNIPGNSHSWRNPAQANPGFICGKGANFEAKLAGKNGVSSRTYTFEISTLINRSGSYSDGMIASCTKLGMKPVCDHPSYCKNDAKSVYLGQTGHLAYKPHRNNNNYSPGGLASIRDKWNGLCSYTAKANGNKALCNIPTNSHSWQGNNVNPGFVCGAGSQFKATLQGKNGVSARSYIFEIASATPANGKYSDRMRSACSKLGMKPVCDHRNYCGSDKGSIFLGQTHHLAYAPHRNNNNYSPPGLETIRDNWSGLCSYTNNANGNYALCNIPTNTHAWRHPGQYNPGFVCGKEDILQFTGTLGGKNGVATRKYMFAGIKLMSKKGSYSELMVARCEQYGMKPVCDHRNYCAKDKKSLFLGQTHHLAYKPHRNNNNYQPTGMAAIRDNWNGKCSYTANANGAYALCNIPINTHAWRNPAQANPGFICGKGATFTAKIGSKNGAQARTYSFEVGFLAVRNGKYSDRMRQTCEKYGMKPVCDHPSYCKNDANAVYLGQTGHLAYAPHRNNNNYSPPGFAAIRNRWKSLCSYTNNANGNYALCNIPTNTHAWRHPGQYNPGFMCATGDTFKAKLAGKNGVAANTWTFAIAGLSARSGKYSTRMQQVCKALGLKPVCDHRNYCKNDANSIYIGQTHHLAYAPHRKNNNYMPAGFAAIASKWDTLCSYTNNANGNYALCNIPTNTHAWRHPGQYNPGFVCGKPDVQQFVGKLAAKNGVGARSYLFRVMELAKKSGSYSEGMIAVCKGIAMKPVCDHRNYCGSDKNSVYIGQTHHLAYRPHRNNNNYSPGGFAAIRDNWNGLCSYTASANGNYALCNIPINTHAWRHPGQYNPGFVCAKGNTFTAKFGGKNGVGSRTYTFEIMVLAARNGKYSDRMREQCKKIGMKPVCDHRNYCKNDKASVYLGQTHHLAYRPHRNNNNYSPPGLAAIRDKWNGLCSYTNNANGNYALCNVPINTHAWRHPGQYNPGFVCAKGATFMAMIRGKNGLKDATYLFETVSLVARNGKYSDRMKEQCSKVGMKPICDHRNYCANDKGALWIGQTHHMAYRPHRMNNNYMPGGFSAIAKRWDNLCSYTGNANGNYALCNIPINTHAWRHPGQYNPGFVCGKEDIVIFSQAIGSKNGNIPRVYNFRVAALDTKTGKYSDLMAKKCKEFGMKPVCDHPSWCRNHKDSIYLGQSGHLAYKPHRNNNNYMPPGLKEIRDNWANLCSFSGNANGNNAICNIPANSHSWRNPAQANPGFVCAAGASFRQKIGSKNGATGKLYNFEIGFLTARSGKYSTRMIERCKIFGMKPVCDHPNYCKNDNQAVYLGQSGHLAYRPHRNNNGYSPTGFAAIRDKWIGLCSYTRNANGNNALCNIPTNTHAWRNPGQANPGFMCAAGLIIKASLGAKNGVPASKYLFAVGFLSSKSGKYSDRMVEVCGKMEMKPTCDHRNYCKNDAKSLYIGQTHHLAYAPHRNNANYMPAGFNYIQPLWDGVCSYTGNANGNYALCNIPSNTHAWRYPGQYDGGFVCGKLDQPTFSARLTAKNGNNGRTYLFRVAKLPIPPTQTKYIRITSASNVNPGGTQHSAGHSWDLYEFTCTLGGKAAKYTVEKASHMDYNGRYPAKSIHDGNLGTFWAGHPGACGGQALIKGCQWIVLKLANVVPGNKQLKCALAQDKKDKRWALAKMTLSQSSDLENWSAEKEWKLKYTGVTNNIMTQKLQAVKGKYTDLMVKECKNFAMKPVCDHPSWCKNDARSVYLGQTGHLAYKPHRNNNNYSPGGFAAVRDKWNGLCSFSGNANGNAAICNIPANSHSWQNVNRNPGFMCAKGASFDGIFGGKNGVMAGGYSFEATTTANRSGKYSDRMRESCKKLGMKPVCDHPSYCKNDAKSVYLGQSGHLAYKPHRNNNNYSPPGLSTIRDKWNGLCSYTNNANGNNALCNIPTNTHAWRNPGQYNPGFICAIRKVIRASLQGKNGVETKDYIFGIAVASPANGKYSDRMRTACTKLGMKPVCDHRNYCKNDAKALYLGQDHHLAYAPHRNAEQYLPPGLEKIANYWNTLCSYTNNANGNYALCNIPTNTHAWRHPGQYNPGFMCGKEDIVSFSAAIGSKNGNIPRKYDFVVAQSKSTSGKYSDLMIKTCGAWGMKPVCDHPSWCKTDKKSVYLGQSGHLAYKPHRNNNNYSPPGLKGIRDKWNNLCSYSGNANGNNAICNIPANSHSWKTAAQANPGFICAKGASWTALIGSKNGAKGREYQFETGYLRGRNGKYSDRMREQCKLFGMKPVCDHPSYCKNDKASVYLGQSGHLAYRPHRYNNNYSPPGLAGIRDKWNGLCSYTNNANGNYALCNIPTNTHAWRHPGQTNPGFVCAAGSVFYASLKGKNGVPDAKYVFSIASASPANGKYSTRMISACKGLNMKPVCDHRAYCGSDAASLFIGQTHHIAYAPHRNNNNYMPVGFATIAKKWDGLCSYTRNANGNYALCNIPTNTHAWRHPGQYNPGFVCGRENANIFTARLGAKNGVASRQYAFRTAVLSARSGKYSDGMVKACGAYGMKPVCDHRNYCKSDKAAVYIGQTHHLAYRPHRNNNNYSPTGFAAIRNNWNNLCSYTGNANGNNALCNIPINTHAWRNPGQANPGFICAKGANFEAVLGGKNGVPGRMYNFEIAVLAARSGKYSTRMQQQCTKLGMKPVCDHRNYCANDAKSIYIGQTHHLAYRPHRNNNGYMPGNFAAIRDRWNSLCSYTNNANGNNALCNIPINSHAWRNPGQANPGFVCGAVTTVKVDLGGKNGVKSNSWTLAVTGLSARNGRYSDRMVEQCSAMSMKPVCDHPAYCKQDAKAAYLGQSGHLAYAPHRNNDGYMPKGLKEVRKMWSSLCSYTANANGNNALCNIPTNTHAWRNPGQYNPGFVCATLGHATATVYLGPKNGVAAKTWMFSATKLTTRSGKYSTRMIQKCDELGMKPVCDHRNYCKNDKAAVYIGQQHHIAYRPHRNNNNYMPSGFAAVRDMWNGLCSYTGNANGNNALCNIPTNTHAWRNPGQYNPGFVCGKAATFSATLAAKNGARGGLFEFTIAKSAARNGKYSTRMEQACTKLGMKPVCDHRNYCKNSNKALYIGQTHHLAYRPHRNNNNYSPAGFSDIRQQWNGLCSYTGNANGNYALCNIPVNTHAWRHPGQANPGFVCGKPGSFTVKLGAKNGAKAGEYKFTIGSLQSRGGKYSDRMVQTCNIYKMKPICDHPSWCKNNKQSLYIGQSGHMAYAPHRNNLGYLPSGLAPYRNMWSNLCSFSGNANGNYAICNIPSNTHAWRHPGQANPGFMCGATASQCAASQVANSNFAKKGSIKGATGATITVKCNNNFEGGGKVTCGPNGKFTTVSCKKQEICASKKVANSNKSGGTGKIASGKTVSITCKSGYTGGGKLLCAYKKWFWDVGGECKKKQCDSIKIANSNKANGSGDGKVGDKISVKCNDGYTGSNSLTCGSNQKWSALTCKKKSAPNKCKGDVDGNNKVNIEDLLILLGNYGKTCNSGNKHCAGADQDVNGKVNIEDLLVLLGSYGKRC